MARPKNFEKQGDHTGPRMRASEVAIRTAIKAAKAEGLIVDRLSVSGSYVEVHILRDGENQIEERNDGLESWYDEPRQKRTKKDDGLKDW